MEAALRNEIEAALGPLVAGAPVLLQPMRVEKVFELFVLSCLVRALASLDATMVAKDSADSPTTELVFRLGPGLVFSPASAPGFIHVTYNNAEYEIQNSLRVLGASQVLHELDVALLDRSVARRCRQVGMNPPPASIRFLAECKYYGATLPLGLGREFIGLSREFSLRVKTIVANISNDDVHKLVTKYHGTENFDITPLEPSNVDRFIKWLANELRQVL